MYLRTSAKDLFQCLFEKRNERGLLIAILMTHPKIDRLYLYITKL